MTDGVNRCAKCHGPPVKHRQSFCDTCYTQSRKDMREAIQQHKEETGECVRCLGKALPHKRYCEKHLEYIKGASKRQYRKENPEVKRVYRCSRCHEPGHFAISCKQPKPAWKL